MKIKQDEYRQRNYVDNLYILQGSFINQPYNINGNKMKLLDDDTT